MDIFIIDHWYDWWRLAILLVATLCLVLLAEQFRACRAQWDSRPRDRWYMTVMWCLAAWSMQVEGLLVDAPLRARLIFVSVAILITLKLLLKRSDWNNA